jgi:hypothetical protein
LRSQRHHESLPRRLICRTLPFGCSILRLGTKKPSRVAVHSVTIDFGEKWESRKEVRTSACRFPPGSRNSCQTRTRFPLRHWQVRHSDLAREATQTGVLSSTLCNASQDAPPACQCDPCHGRTKPRRQDASRPADAVDTIASRRSPGRRRLPALRPVVSRKRGTRLVSLSSSTGWVTCSDAVRHIR